MSGVPLSKDITKTKNALSGLNLDILGNVISRPRGKEIINVEKKIINDAPAPPNI